MIEIRKLIEQEVPYASELARVVYRTSIEPRCADVQLRRMFDGYVESEALAKRFRDGRLLLWGAFEDGQMYGISGMQPEGHITMLYVLPPYQGRNIGRNLLAVMQTYAYSELKLPRVTVSAMPVWTAGYFQKDQFQMLGQPDGALFSYLEKRNPAGAAMAGKDDPVKYRARPIPVPQVLVLSIGTLGVVTLLSVIYALTTIL